MLKAMKRRVAKPNRADIQALSLAKTVQTTNTLPSCAGNQSTPGSQTGGKGSKRKEMKDNNDEVAESPATM